MTVVFGLSSRRQWLGIIGGAASRCMDVVAVGRCLRVVCECVAERERVGVLERERDRVLFFKS